jgi:hypothetical protein
MFKNISVDLLGDEIDRYEVYRKILAYKEPQAYGKEDTYKYGELVSYYGKDWLRTTWGGDEEPYWNVSQQISQFNVPQLSHALNDYRRASLKSSSPLAAYKWARAIIAIEANRFGGTKLAKELGLYDSDYRKELQTALSVPSDIWFVTPVQYALVRNRFDNALNMKTGFNIALLCARLLLDRQSSPLKQKRVWSGEWLESQVISYLGVARYHEESVALGQIRVKNALKSGDKEKIGRFYASLGYIAQIAYEHPSNLKQPKDPKYARLSIEALRMTKKLGTKAYDARARLVEADLIKKLKALGEKI